MSCGSKDTQKFHSISCTNTHHEVTHIVNHGMVKTTKNLKATFLENKKSLNLRLCTGGNL